MGSESQTLTDAQRDVLRHLGDDGAPAGEDTIALDSEAVASLCALGLVGLYITQDGRRALAAGGEET